MQTSLKETLQQLPNKPGVYQYYNTDGQLLYVGKAKDLSKRVNSYWQKTRTHSPWTELLIEEVNSIKVIEVSTELEALMLENSLIKSLKPKYNLQLRDDKTFPFLRISKEAFPTFTITRKVKSDKARYIGPFFSATYIRSILKLLQELYGIKIANEKSYEARSKVPQQIGLGARNLDNQDIYMTNVEQAIKFFSSPQPQMERIIKLAMQAASDNFEFERAAKLRDRIVMLEQLRNTQSLFSPGGKNRDYLGIEQVGKLISVYVLFERGGNMVNHKNFTFEFQHDLLPEELVYLVVTYLYVNGLTIPQQIVAPHEPKEAHVLVDLFQEQVGRKVSFLIPQRGEAKKRLETATENAKYQLQLESLKKQRRESGVAALAKLLELPNLPRRIEAFDISNLGATNIVGASIVFIDGKPAKNEYRKYKITPLIGQDDFASMRELVFRRMSNPDRPLPDLLLIDGGKGQLSAALDSLELAKKTAPCMALAKKEEIIFLPGKSEPISLPHDSDALLLLTAIRDEVHRFVISFHRQRRKKQLLSS